MRAFRCIMDGVYAGSTGVRRARGQKSRRAGRLPQEPPRRYRGGTPPKPCPTTVAIERASPPAWSGSVGESWARSPRSRRPDLQGSTWSIRARISRVASRPTEGGRMRGRAPTRAVPARRNGPRRAARGPLRPLPLDPQHRRRRRRYPARVTSPRVALAAFPNSRTASPRRSRGSTTRPSPSTTMNSSWPPSRSSAFSRRASSSSASSAKPWRRSPRAISGHVQRPHVLWCCKPGVGVGASERLAVSGDSEQLRRESGGRCRTAYVSRSASGKPSKKLPAWLPGRRPTGWP